MVTGRVICLFFLSCACAGPLHGQDAPPDPLAASPPGQGQEPVLKHRPSVTPASAPNESIPLTVPRGAPIQVALDKETRVQRVGQLIHGRVNQPVYAFDKLVIPVGTAVLGQITKIEEISGKKRALSILNADFTPAHKIDIEFNGLVLADGKRIPIRTVVAAGSGQVIQFVSANDGDKKGKKRTTGDLASEKLKAAKQQARQEWENAMKQVKEPGKMHRLGRYAAGLLPVHRQYINAGTLYFAELQEPLDFGSEPLEAKTAASMDTPPPAGSLVHALLVTPLNSATTKKGADVEAILSQPLFDGDRLVLPQGSRLRGSVVDVEPARYLRRNGQIRLAFHQLIPPNGVEQRVDASLEGVQSGKEDQVHLDSEGGARASSSKTRYLSTGVSVALAVASFGRDADAPAGGNAAGNTSNRVAGGAGGFKLIGIALGAFVHSRPLGLGMGVYGASMSAYAHFIARGRDVDFPKNTTMEIGLGGRIAPHEPTFSRSAPGCSKCPTDSAPSGAALPRSR